MGGYVVKAQVLGGGRGLGHFKETGFKSGVHIVKTPAEVKKIAEEMCGKTLVTKQSGDDGLACDCVYIVEKVAIAKEFYLSITLDRKAGCPVFIYSPEGGMSIEDVAHKNPEKIFKLPIDLTKGLDVKDLIKAAKDLGLEEQQSQVVFLFKNVYDCFFEKDCDLIEINPLVLTKDGRVIAADSKITVDDNANFR
jgi:succinyl-CoA synthetase beta subunit